MSRRHELERRMGKLSEIGEIMGSMKNLALMESRKLGSLLESQHRAVSTMEGAAADFLSFYGDGTADQPADLRVLLLVGSERGFCGDFNEELIAALPPEAPGGEIILAAGEKLGFRLESRGRKAMCLPAPVIAEDVPGVLLGLFRALGELHEPASRVALTVLHHRAGAAGLCSTGLLPPFSGLPKPTFGYPPQLNLPPGEFFSGLVNQYLFAALHEIFFASLMAESQARVRHLEAAIQRLDDKLERLGRENRALRQEEITEEIEVILLGAEGLQRK